MKTKYFGILSFTLLAAFSSCRKESLSKNEIETESTDSLLRVFQNRKIIGNPIVNLSKFDAVNNLNALKTSGIIRDSAWSNNLGTTYFVESSDITVSDETFDVTYPGGIFNSKSIANSYSFTPISDREYDPLPIRASLSIPGPSVSGTIDYPGLGETRDFIGTVLARQGNIEQINTFSYTSSEFSDYNELKYTFGANVDIAKIVNVGVDGGGSKIKKRTGVVARFVQENFTVDMSLPRRTELISVADANAMDLEYAPVYISSVTYGRTGVFMAETDASYEDFNVAFKAGVNIGVVGVDTHLTAAQKDMLDRAKITIFMKFGPGAAYTKTVEGYQEFKNAILAGATVSSNSYGGPISFRMRNLKDFSLFKTVFKVDVSK